MDLRNDDRDGGRSSAFGDLDDRGTVVYDTAGNVLSTADPLHDRLTLTYDSGPQPRACAGPPGGMRITSYDADPNGSDRRKALGRRTAGTGDARPGNGETTG